MQNTEQPVLEEEPIAKSLDEEKVIKSTEAEAEKVEKETEESGENETAEETEKVKTESKEEEVEEEAIVISIEGEDEPEEEEKSAPKWVKELRKTNREQAREIKKLQAKIQESSEKKDQTVELGKKPTLQDFDYDEPKFEDALTQWHERKRKIDAQAEEKKQEQQKLEQAYQKRLELYYERKATTKVKDFDELEQMVRDSLKPDIQSAIVMESDQPEMIIAAIGSNPRLLEKFQSVKNGVALGKLIATTELKMTVKSTRKPPPPEQAISGNVGTSGSVKSTLEKLEAEADRTGDRTKLIQYKRKLKNST